MTTKEKGVEITRNKRTRQKQLTKRVGKKIEN